MKLKKLIKITEPGEMLVICNHNDDIIVEGRNDDIRIITDSLGDIEISSTYSEENYLGEAYLVIILNTSINRNDIFRKLSFYIDTLSFEDMTAIVGEKMCCICKGKYNK